MTDISTSFKQDSGEDFFEEKPQAIKVLTVLTFIGSGISLLYSILSPWFLKFSLNMMDKAASSGQELTSKQTEQMEHSRKIIALAQANIVPLVIVGIVSSILCIVGAVMMRKLKKDGFWIYLGGEVLPIISGFVLMGKSQFDGVFSMVIGVGLPIIFIILYAVQRKYLVK
jgi:hypothetical protein